METRKGLIIVNTGDGKGKTTAAFGLGLRAWGHGLNVVVIQFIKGNGQSGELLGADKMDENFVVLQMGKGFVVDGDTNRISHRQAAEEALRLAKEESIKDNWDVMILDEINCAIELGLLRLEEVFDLLAKKRPLLHIVLTGRNAMPALIDRADMVTEMKEIKHPYKTGVSAQLGIEF
ncbi:MAG: cob(I)alamin adenosyltransferase [Firmicutes bacterium]|nr:cob(I)alamin adenosyltransferase [Bacillota bacterium]